MRQFPFRRVRAGQWRVFFTVTRRLEEESGAFVRRIVTVPRARATA